MRYFVCVVLVLGLFFIPSAWAGVNVDINVGAPVVVPPPAQYSAQPDLIVVPGPDYVYMVPGMAGMYFYQGSWFRYYQGYWYRSSYTTGPAWVPIQPYAVPQVILSVPPEYPLFLPPDYYRVHYADVFAHWREWQRERNWDRFEWYRREGSMRQERLRSIERSRAMHAKEKSGVRHEEQRHENDRHRQEREENGRRHEER